MFDKYVQNYFLGLFSIIPISIIIGPSISLINIILIDISFLILLICKKDFFFIKHESIKYFLILYLYLIFNSLISLDIEISLGRNLGFIRIIILFVAINYFFKDNIFINKVFKIWLATIIVVSFDVIFEFYLGRNILGFNSVHGRVVSFFKDEAIVGGYLYGFFLILIGFLHYFLKDNYKGLVLFLSLFLILIIFLTGERSNTIKAILGFILFYSFYDKYNFKHKIILFTFCILSFFILIFNIQYLKTRYIYQITNIFTKSERAENQIYFDLYKSGFNVFKKNILFGVGNKNYRVSTCEEQDNKIKENEKILCNTHPHQIYLEFLSEHGLIGTLLIFFILYKLILSKIRRNIVKLNYIQLSCLIYMLLTFLPLLPSGAFFSNFMITIFILNLSIFYAVNSKLNIFSNST